MEHDGVAWFFRLAACGLVLWTLFLVSRRILRRAGVIAYPPFKSRSEYLAAAEEMNLEDFIGRARETSRSVIEKPTPGTPSLLELIVEVERAAPTTRPDGPASAARQKMASFEPGTWKRTPMGRLVQVARYWDGVVTCNTEVGGVESFCPELLEPAAPKEGEWWCWESAELAAGGRLLLDSREPFQWVKPWEPSTLEPVVEVAAGNLVPVNYGKGPAPQNSFFGHFVGGALPPSGAVGASGALGYPGVSGSPKKKDGVAGFKIGQWVRLKLHGDRLARIADFCDGDVCCSFWERGGQTTFYTGPKTIEAATPRPGEWWRWTKLELSGGFMVFSTEPFQWVRSFQHGELEAVERGLVQQGELEPVNYGFGENTSGVA